MIYQGKTMRKEEKSHDLHSQIVKLTKENQILLTKINSYEQQMSKANNLKQKYKTKYKQMKKQFEGNVQSSTELLPSASSKKRIVKEENPYSLKKPSPARKNFQKLDAPQMLSRIRDSICEFIEKISLLKEQNQLKQSKFQNTQMCTQIDFLARKLDDIVLLIQAKKQFYVSTRSKRFQSQNNDYYFQKTSGKIFQQKEEHISFSSASKKPRQRSSSQNQQYWKDMKELRIKFEEKKKTSMEKKQKNEFYL